MRVVHTLQPSKGDDATVTITNNCDARNNNVTFTTSRDVI